jgi:predicted  nucleic acid-binding Zn-ribbon protein
MSATNLKQVERLARDLDAAYTLLRTLSDQITQLQERILKLENGNRQRRTPGRN